MQHSLLALVVIPELRISDLGLVDVTLRDDRAVRGGPGMTRRPAVLPDAAPARSEFTDPRPRSSG
jgi:hypothetical protein